jgi:hypothetical protein
MLYFEHNAIVFLAIARNYFIKLLEIIYIHVSVSEGQHTHLAGVLVLFSDLYDGDSALNSLYVPW